MSLQNNPQVKAFLDAACIRVRGKKARAEIRAELLDHIEQAASEGKSLDAILSEFGNPREMSGVFATVHRPLYLTAPFIGAFMSIALMFGIVLVSELARQSAEYVSSRVAAVIDTHRARFLEDQKILSEESFFSIPGKQNDAGPFLNPQIKWRGQLTGPFEFLSHNPGLTPPQEMTHKIGLFREHWAEHFRENLDNGADLRWMSKLSQYDHWDLFEWSPMKTILLTDLRDTPWWTFAMPDTTGLMDAAKIRLLRGLRTRDPLPALREVRQLARLIYSNETQISSMIANATLFYESQAYDEAVKQKMIKASDWHPLSHENFIRAKRSLYGYAEFFQIGSPFQDVNLLAGGKFAKAGYCSALAENAIHALILKNRLGGMRFPLEVDFSPEIDKILNLAEDSSNPCRLSYVKYLSANLNAVDHWFQPEGLKDLFRFRIAYSIPWLRQLAALQFQADSFPDYLSGAYRKNLLPDEHELTQNK